MARGSCVGGTAGNGGFSVGGGVAVGVSGTKLLNDTVYGNTSTSGSGQNAGSAFGGGIQDNTADNGGTGGLSIINVTVSANTVQAGTPASGTSGTLLGGGIDNEGVSGDTADPALTVQNTLVTGNLALDDTGTNVEASGPDFFGSAATANNDLLGDGTGASGFTDPSNNVGVVAKIGPLQNNGGNTQTVALLAGSPAINAGSDADINAALTAAGLPSTTISLRHRFPTNRRLSRSTSGAFELQTALPTTTTLNPITAPASVGLSVPLVATVNVPTATGTVTFFDTVDGAATPITLGTATLSSSTATLPAVFLPQGTNVITAQYSGDTTSYGSSSSSPPRPSSSVRLPDPPPLRRTSPTAIRRPPTTCEPRSPRPTAPPATPRSCWPRAFTR